MKFIDGIEVANPFFLAPMAGVTDHAFRTICAEKGAALTYTEMVSAKALCYSDRKTAELLSIAGEHRPCFAQIFGSEPEVCAKGAVLALKISRADGIDINMGCPMPKIVKNGEGSALMRDTDRIYRLVKAVSAAVDVPVTVKIRAGYDAEHINAIEAACAAEEAGAAAIGVHGRTREQLYMGTSSRAVIASVKKAVKVPVIASGDAFSAEDCIEILKETQSDFVMIARGAQGNPDIFEQWKKWRVANITAVVAGASKRIRSQKPGVKISAAVFSNPETAPNMVAQDWIDWCRKGYLDFVCPMNYLNSAALQRATTQMQLKAVAGLPVKVYPGIGLSVFKKDGCDARRLSEQIVEIRECGAPGFSVFNFDKRALDALPQIFKNEAGGIDK